jgi:hypothetical protein
MRSNAERSALKGRIPYHPKLSQNSSADRKRRKTHTAATNASIYAVRLPTIGLAMSKLIKIMAGLAFASVGLAAPAHADANQDKEFYRLLTEPDPDHPRTIPMVISNFPLVRSQGIEVCQGMDAGETPIEAVYHLDRRYGGPYPFDDANDIANSALTAYCPWHQVALTAPDWSTTPTPISWRPVYPPLAWNPESPPPVHLPPGYNDGD